MEVRDWVMIISALIVTVGWFVTGYINRRNETAKKRADYRLEMLQSYWPILFFIQKWQSDPGWMNHDKRLEVQNLIETARSKFLLYGYDDEIVLFESFVESVTSREGKPA